MNDMLSGNCNEEAYALQRHFKPEKYNKLKLEACRNGSAKFS